MRQQVERLAGHLFDGAGGALAEEVAAWLEGSARLRTFVEAHRDKVRKKLRGAANDEARQDVRTELLTARLLLADRRLELDFEAYGAGKPGPDFTVAFRGAKAFNLEVTRLRRSTEAPGGLTGPLLAKLRQLPPGVANAVLVALGGEGAAAPDVAATARMLRARADAKEESYFAERGFAGTRDFYDRYLRLSAVIVFREGAVGGGGRRSGATGRHGTRCPKRPDGHVCCA
jgi:hypothetical protein